LRTLDAQARAIWPQERTFIKRVFTRPGLDVLDVGCGTGESSQQLKKGEHKTRVLLSFVLAFRIWEEIDTAIPALFIEYLVNGAVALIWAHPLLNSVGGGSDSLLPLD